MQKLKILNDDELNILNPTILFEVFSPGTGNYDRNEKFLLYQDIPTLKEYVLIDPDTIHVEAFQKSASGDWQSVVYSKVDDGLRTPTIDFTIELKGIYRNTKAILVV